MAHIFHLLQRATRYDYSLHKMSTVQRRMAIHALTTCIVIFRDVPLASKDPGQHYLVTPRVFLSGCGQARFAGSSVLLPRNATPLRPLTNGRM